MKVKVPKQRAALVRFCMHPVGKFLLVSTLAVGLLGLGAFGFYYFRFARLIDAKLDADPFSRTSMLFAAPEMLMVGDTVTSREIVEQLRRAGYGESRNNRMGWYHERPDGVDIFPGPDSYFDDEPAVIKVAGGKISQIISLKDQAPRTLYLMEPELITNLFDRNREKRRLLAFEDIPKVLVNAVVSAEDKRFFQHVGFDPFRLAKAVYRDVKENRKAEGASTLSMQLSRLFFLNQEKTYKRKLAEMMITLHLEMKLSKETIFEYYANQVPLGRRGSFSIHGFGEASQAFLGKDIKDIGLADAALLAGLAQRPSYTNPVKWPDRARTRRNVILWLMRENGYISDREYADAAASPVRTASGDMESTEAPFFVDTVNDALLSDFQDHDFQANGYRIYTTLDMNLQREAAEAVRVGMQEVDEQIRRKTRKGEATGALPQVAMVALDAHTGEVKAFVGGRDYGVSQLNHSLAKRQPGSVFKPFVYAAALNTVLNSAGGDAWYTPSSVLQDEPTTFWFDNRPYEPGNHHDQYFGQVTLRQAIAKSLNIPTVHLAESVGYRTVVDLARRAGMNVDVRATPSVALGAYEVTALEVAGAYTTFANRGMYVKPSLIRKIRSKRGGVVHEAKPERRAVLDPRVNYLMVSLMEDVLRSGTGAGVRSRGFTLPAAGKTGTSRDGWFAGFTSKLICVVWVGYDDNRELRLEGARSALPIWTEFMKRAHRYRAYRNASNFDAPDGVVSVALDPASGELATESCPTRRAEYFITGTQPAEVCRLHGGGTQVAGWDIAAHSPLATEPEALPTRRDRRPVPASADSSAVAEAAPVTPAGQATERPRERRGLFGRIRDIFK